jgi:ubiquitin C-terminal hydrolase
MTNFDKVNKGLANQNINCFMNVCLQSLMACPAFFNMLTVVSENQENECFSKDKDVLTKFVELSRYFEPRIQVMSSKQGAEIYKKKIVDAQDIFMKELYDFNPENIQADTSEFFSYIMDKLHEELKGIYVSN